MVTRAASFGSSLHQAFLRAGRESLWWCLESRVGRTGAAGYLKVAVVCLPLLTAIAFVRLINPTFGVVLPGAVAGDLGKGGRSGTCFPRCREHAWQAWSVAKASHGQFLESIPRPAWLVSRKNSGAASSRDSMPSYPRAAFHFASRDQSSWMGTLPVPHGGVDGVYSTLDPLSRASPWIEATTRVVLAGENSVPPEFR